MQIFSREYAKAKESYFDGEHLEATFFQYGEWKSQRIVFVHWHLKIDLYSL